MKSIVNEQISEIEIKKSRFICYLKNVNTEQEAKEYISALKKMHPSAAHHCSAYRVGSIDRANDDGEPSQTAGMPMLNVLMHNELVNTIAVVVRYFGGVKLGAGGLVRAYTDSVVQALNDAEVSALTAGVKFQIKASYSDIDKINYILKQLNIVNYNVRYEQNIVFDLEISKEKFEVVSDQITAYNHLIKFENLEETIVVED